MFGSLPNLMQDLPQQGRQGYAMLLQHERCIEESPDLHIRNRPAHDLSIKYPISQKCGEACDFR
jgi:hypothetical protein